MRHPLRRFRGTTIPERWLPSGMTVLTAMVLLAGGSVSSVLVAADPKSAVEAPKTFSAIIEEQAKGTISLVAAYVAEHPEADDAELAYRWLFETVRTHGREPDVLAAADAYLQRTGDNHPSRTLAQLVKCIGLARTGKLPEAMAVYEAHLKTSRIRMPNDTIDLAVGLSTQAQLAGDYATARDVYDKLSTGLFLNPAVREFADNRIRKLELARKPAPEISVEDLDGKKVAPTELAGKVVLVDFWGTNCPPCIIEFPSLKKLHADFNPRGFEIIGISLDEDRATVEEFQKQTKLSWRLALSSSDHDATRRRYEAAKIPSTYLLDQQGKLVGVDLQGRDLRQAVERLLGGAAASPKGSATP